MDLKELFGQKKRGKRKSEEIRPASVEDLIVLERYDEAEDRLKQRLKANVRDNRSLLKLADVHMKMGKGADAVEEYLTVCDGYAREGFLDKAIALLTKVQRLVPMDEKIPMKIQALRQAKRMEHSRDVVMKDLTQRRAAGGGVTTTSAMDLQSIWRSLMGSHLVGRLSDDQLKKLLGATHTATLKEGEVLVMQDQTLEELFIIGEGRLEAHVRTADGSSTNLRAFGPGDLIGDRALFEHKPWLATYRAAEPTKLLRLTKDGLGEALAGNSDPRGFLEILRERRLDMELEGSIRRLSQV